MASSREDVGTVLELIDESNVENESDGSDFEILNEEDDGEEPTIADDSSEEEDYDDSNSSSSDSDSEKDASKRTRLDRKSKKPSRGSVVTTRSRGLRARPKQGSEEVLSQADENAGWTLVNANFTDSSVCGEVDLPFSVKTPGLYNIPAGTITPLNFFMLFITPDMMIQMVRETNRYAKEFIAQLGNVGRYSRFRQWKDVTVEDIKSYLGLCINMGLVKKDSLKDYWQSKFSSSDCPYFRSVMSYNRFFMINQFFHLNDTNRQTPRGRPGFDPWHKIRPLLDSLNDNVKRYFIPNRQVYLDGLIVGTKNGKVILQDMPNKRSSRFGIKKLLLRDSLTGYVYHIQLYVGRDFDVGREDGQPVGVVKYIMDQCDLYNKGYHLFTDSNYTRVSLAVELLQKKTLLTGTVAKNLRDFPKSLFKSKLEVNQTEFMQSVGVLGCAYREKRSHRKSLCLLSTAALPDVHSVRIGSQQERKTPSCVLMYNRVMGGYGSVRRKIFEVVSERDTHRYWVKIYRFLIDIVLHNSYELYKLSNPVSKLSYLDFISKVVENLCPIPKQYPPSDDHKLVTLEGRKERNCVVCSDRSIGHRSRSRTWCPGCGVGVHKRCFDKLHF